MNNFLFILCFVLGIFGYFIGGSYIGYLMVKMIQSGGAIPYELFLTSMIYSIGCILFSVYFFPKVYHKIQYVALILGGGMMLGAMIGM